MKRFIITSVCTLGLTLLGAFGGYKNSSYLADVLNGVNNTTKVEQNVTNTDIQQGLPTTAAEVKSAVAQNTDNKQVKAVQTSAKKNTKAVKSIKKNSTANKKNTAAKKNSNTANLINTAKVKSATSKLTYNNIDLSNCNSVQEVISKLQKNGCTNITSANINNIKGLKDVLACIKQNNPQTTPTAAPAPTTKPTPTTAPTPTKKPTPTATPAPTTKPVTTTPTPTAKPGSSELSSYADQVLKLVNQERAKAGLSALTTNSTLTAAANKRAQETAKSFSHTRPDGSSFSTVLKEYGISYRMSGENIAYGQKTPQEVVTGWMNSEGHRANILNGSFGKIGIGVYKSNGVIYWSQLFTN